METMYVTAFTFGKDGWTYPRRIELDGITYDFIDKGLRVNVRNGASDCQLMTATDGRHTFHLRSRDRGSTWSLVKFA